eukprot:9475379-Pyramimonas_sp.AAC.1
MLTKRSTFHSHTPGTLLPRGDQTYEYMLWYGPKLKVPGDAVKTATENYLRAFTAAWGPSYFLWKHHSILHHSSYVNRFGYSPNTLCLERKHKSVLKWAEDCSKEGLQWRDQKCSQSDVA